MRVYLWFVPFHSSSLSLVLALSLSCESALRGQDTGSWFQFGEISGLAVQI